MLKFCRAVVEQSRGPGQTGRVLQSKHIYKVGGGGGPVAVLGPLVCRLPLAVSHVPCTHHMLMSPSLTSLHITITRGIIYIYMQPSPPPPPPPPPAPNIFHQILNCIDVYSTKFNLESSSLLEKQSQSISSSPIRWNWIVRRVCSVVELILLKIYFLYRDLR